MRGKRVTQEFNQKTVFLKIMEKEFSKTFDSKNNSICILFFYFKKVK